MYIKDLFSSKTKNIKNKINNIFDTNAVKRYLPSFRYFLSRKKSRTKIRHTAMQMSKFVVRSSIISLIFKT